MTQSYSVLFSRRKIHYLLDAGLKVGPIVSEMRKTQTKMEVDDKVKGLQSKLKLYFLTSHLLNAASVLFLFKGASTNGLKLQAG